MRRLQQHAVGIAVDDALERREGLVADRIGALLGRFLQLGRVGNELLADRIIGMRDQCRHRRRNGDGKAAGDGFDFGQACHIDQPQIGEIGCTTQGAGFHLPW